jgi:hypothetical protein
MWVVLLYATLALTLSFAPPDPVAEPASEPAPTETTSDPDPQAPRDAGTIVLAPLQAGEYRLHDAQGKPIGAPMQLGDGKHATMQLPSGVYHMQGPTSTHTLVVVSGPALAWNGETVVPREVWASELAAQREQAEQAALAPRVPEPPASQHNWRAWASPLGSTFVPGLGQFFNGQGGKGTGILFGTIGSVAGAAALYSLGNDGTRPLGAEYARLVGYGALSTSAMLLWIYGIADAYRVATDKRVEPELGHRVRISVTRMMTVGFRADQRRPGFFDDWSVSVMGQPVRRLSVGVSDLSVKPGGITGPQVWQFGLRLDYRVLERKRLWIDVAVGSLMQVAVGQRHDPLDPDVATPRPERRFGAAPYGQLDFRIFVLDRVSLDIIPRLTVPVTTRYYSLNRALPRFAPELELGAGISAYF